MRPGAIFLSLCLLFTITACDSSSGNPDAAAPGPEAGVGDVGSGDVGGAGCKTSAECQGGVCVAGACCPSKERACGDVCCKASESCFAGACVTPGGLCVSAADCLADQYCEPALGPKAGGDAGAGSVDGGGRTCLAPAPRVGRCVSLPPRCPAGTDAGVGGADAGASCLPACTYKPKAAPLKAKVKWRWGPTAKAHANVTDVWSTPVVGRVYDTNCDGKVDELDPPNIIFVSGDAKGTCAGCGTTTPSTSKTGVLRMLDGATGKEIWSLAKASASSIGFMGLTIATGDLDGDQRMDIVAVTGEGYVVLIDADGKVKRTSDKVIPGSANDSFGWGGALAVADMDADGYPEVAYGATVFTTKGGGLTLLWTGAGGTAGPATRSISTFVDLDGAADHHLELLAGNTAYQADGSVLWQNAALPNGYPGVGDLDGDGAPEAVLVESGQVWVLEGKTGKVLLGPVTLAATGNGGPPTVADFDGDGKREIGVAMQTVYSVVKPDLAKKQLGILWQAANHDLSSSVTGSTVFDFEGDGAAEVIYNDECFLWVYDGKTGKVRFATPTTSFTATEASLLADVDGDGHAEMVMVSNGADPSASGWKCDVDPWNKADPTTGRPAWTPPKGAPAYRGLTVWGDTASSWVGTRTLWNQHTYHVTNICDSRDSACTAPNVYGTIPKVERQNWKVGWLNNFRQNVQEKGLFDAPDATVSVVVECISPVVLHAYVRNQGFALLPAGVEVGFFVRRSSGDVLLGKAVTAGALFPGQVTDVTYTVAPADGGTLDLYLAKLLVDPTNPTFHECRETNNESEPQKAKCVLE